MSAFSDTASTSLTLHTRDIRSDWEVFVGLIATNILEEQTPKRLFDVRSQFYDLLVSFPFPHSTSGFYSHLHAYALVHSCECMFVY